MVEGGNAGVDVTGGSAASTRTLDCNSDMLDGRSSGSRGCVTSGSTDGTIDEEAVTDSRSNSGPGMAVGLTDARSK